MFKINGKSYSSVDYEKFFTSLNHLNSDYEIYKFIYTWINPKNKNFNFKTSGSTGTKPKIISFKRKDILQSVKLTQSVFNFRENENIILALPIEFIAAKMLVIRAIENKMNLIIQEPNLNPFKIKSKVDVISVVPMQLLNGIKQNFENVKKVKTILVGGANIPLQIENMKLKNVFVTYGMTETLTHIALRKLGEIYFNAIGNVTFKTDKNKRLILSTPHLSKKIINTNDVVNLISNTKFQFLGRFDNVINSGGVKLYPETIENKISGLVENNYFISSIKDELLGEKLILIIESKLITETKIKRLNQSLKKVLTKYECPKEIYFLPKFVKTLSGKLNKIETKKLINL